MAMRFEVPQFIDIKDKIFGPFTFMQFIYMAGGFGLGYLMIKIIPSILKYPAGLVFVVLGLALAFYKVNGRPFAVILQAFFSYIFGSKVYTWHQRPVSVKKEDDKKKQQASLKEKVETVEQQVNDAKLKDLAWNLDILDKSQ